MEWAASSAKKLKSECDLGVCGGWGGALAAFTSFNRTEKEGEQELCSALPSASLSSVQMRISTTSGSELPTLPLQVIVWSSSDVSIRRKG